MAYGVLTLREVALCMDEIELWNALNYRSQQTCMIYKSEDFEYLSMMVRVRYRSLMAMNTDPHLQSLILPEAATQSYALSSFVPGAAVATLNQSIKYGSWAISGLNGFWTAATIEEMIGVIATEQVVYPIAIWAGTPEKAQYIGRREYVRRFFQHFDGRVEQPRLPIQEARAFIDPYFEQREDRRRQLGETAKVFMETVIERAW